jgi:DNA primase
MQESAKYLIQADVTANGVVERSDVVGAVFGQTEGLLGDELDLRDLQQSGKVGRIDVSIRSENGQSFGDVTIASGLDKIETSILAAGLETIERVGPCRADVSVDRIEDVRAAKRRAVVERAKELLSEFDEDVMSSDEIVAEVRQAVRVADITQYEGLPAGPRVADSDAIIVVEGRADVRQLLQYGIKNAIAVEGTNVPDAVANLTQDRTVTAFLDGDRGGDMICKELDQVGNIDYVAFAPAGESVEDLSRDQIMAALREKVPYEAIADASSPHETVTATDGSARPAPPDAMETPGPDDEGVATDDADEPSPSDAGAEASAADDAAGATAKSDAAAASDTDGSEDGEPGDGEPGDGEPGDGEPAGGQSDEEAAVETGEEAAPPDPDTLAGHVLAVVGEDSGTVRLLDSEFGVVDSAPVAEAFETVANAEQVPATVVIDGELTQRVLDVAAQRGVERIVAESEGEFVKKPTGVRIRTAEEFAGEQPSATSH